MILETILQRKRDEVAAKRGQLPLDEIRAQIRDLPPVRDFPGSVASQGRGIRLIAELKRISPSAGPLRDFSASALAGSYEAAGAVALSVLTDAPFFGGNSEDLADAKDAVRLPVLRKDFVIDAYQIYETRLLGADAVLLIAAALPENVLKDLVGLTTEVGLCPFVETHTAEEVTAALRTTARVIGINNRDLRTFRVAIGTTLNLRHLIPPDRIVVSESGYSCRAEVARVERAGVDAILIGESLLRAPDVASKVRELLGASE
ncbi:MAG: indole-3-glycerol phosphate synthase TrpC [Gemmatimonadota bacterium]